MTERLHSWPHRPWLCVPSHRLCGPRVHSNSHLASEARVQSQHSSSLPQSHSVRRINIQYNNNTTPSLGIKPFLHEFVNISSSSCLLFIPSLRQIALRSRWNGTLFALIGSHLSVLVSNWSAPGLCSIRRIRCPLDLVHTSSLSPLSSD